MMQIQKKGRCLLLAGVALLVAVAVGFGCTNDDFQPLTYGAKPWTPPAGWDPQPLNSGGGLSQCPTGYYIAIRSCDGCTGISYALCDGWTFSQCVCGGPAWKYPSAVGSTCPQLLSCDSGDFPPPNWLEYVDYNGPGRATQPSPDAGN
jgi:hypothetical protein